MTSRTIASIAAITANMYSRDVSIADLVDMAILRVGCNLKSEQIIEENSFVRACVAARLCVRTVVCLSACVYILICISTCLDN